MLDGLTKIGRAPGTAGRQGPNRRRTKRREAGRIILPDHDAALAGTVSGALGLAAHENGPQLRSRRGPGPANYLCCHRTWQGATPGVVIHLFHWLHR
jgi:hypothetical protein